MPANVEIDPELLKNAAGKIAIITGGANGIGAATASLLNSAGATVVVADLEQSRKNASELIHALPHPDRAFFMPLNILDWEQGKRLFGNVASKFGGVDIVVANAGIMETAPTLDLSNVDADGGPVQPLEAYRVIDVNLKGTLNTLKLALHYMKEKGGSIVLTISTSGYVGGTGVSAYVASKHGVVGLLRASKATAQAHGIRINAVAPFFTPTKITSSFSKEWKKSGLEANTSAGVAAVIAQVALDPEQHGSSILTVGNMRRELEHSRDALLPDWWGKDLVDVFGTARRFFDGLGGYPLPKTQPKL